MIDFLSRLVMSFSGFVATIVLTRTLGPEQYGTYVVVLSVIAWVAMAGKFGLPQAIKKRVSESDDRNYVLSGAIVQSSLYLVLAICLWLGRHWLNEFIGMEATWILILMLGVHLGLSFVQTVLDGQHLVYLSSILVPVEWTSRSVVQVVLVLSGFSIAGAFAGYIVGALVAAAIGSYFMSVPRTVPTRQDFSRLKSYAQFSWLGSIKGRMFQSMDTIILAIFVSNSLIAVYEIAWNLASLFAIFGVSISRTLFPEMSKISSEKESPQEIVGLLRVSLSYTGLFIIPGLVGAALVGDVVLTIYGEGFETGYYILLVLTFARLLYGYSSQLINTINAVDRPDLTLYINAVFVAANMSLNVVLTWQFGWYGAATATTVSSGLSLLIGYYYASQIVNVVIPVIEIAKQCLAAGIMAVCVLAGRVLVGDSLPIIVALVVVGAAVYFTVLLALSQEFRTTVQENLPFEFPRLSPE
jgi:O-antigen/teichoic acid export membrane protein